MTATQLPDEPNVNALLLENALLRAGVDLDSVAGQTLRDAWENKEIDAAKIAQQWDALKPPAAAAPPAVDSATTEPEPPASPATDPQGDPRIEGESGMADERQFLAGGPTSNVTHDQDVRTSSMDAGREALAKGATREDAMATAFKSRALAAANGDASVLVDESLPAS